LVKHQYGWRRDTALGGGRVLLGGSLARGQRIRALDDPDPIKSIDRDASDLTKNPIIRQRLRPQSIDLELGKRGLRILRNGSELPGENYGGGEQSNGNAFHHFLPCCPKSGRFELQI